MNQDMVTIRQENEGIDGLVPWYWDIDMSHCVSPVDQTVSTIKKIFRSNLAIECYINGDETISLFVKNKTANDHLNSLLYKINDCGDRLYNLEIFNFLDVLKKLRKMHNVSQVYPG